MSKLIVFVFCWSASVSCKRQELQLFSLETCLSGGYYLCLPMNNLLFIYNNQYKTQSIVSMPICTCCNRNNSEKRFEKKITNENKLSRNNCGYIVRYCSVSDLISKIDAGHGIGGHKEINGVYRMVKEKCF